LPRVPQLFAHRGARRAAPENTLPAFARALEMGVDGVELDVHLSCDGRLVVFHDYTLDRLTNGSGPVAEHSAAELAALDAGTHFDSSYAKTGIPTLDQVLDLIGDQCAVNVEIKSIEPDGGPAVQALARTIASRNLYDQVIVSSFNPISLIHLRWLDPAIRLGLLFAAPLPAHLRFAWFTPILQPEALHPCSERVDANFMEWARDRGCAVNVWTVNDLNEARRLQHLGVDAIITDVPDALIAGLSA
jgi:glycerophosphoryl diester phosphodiesterase